MQFAHICRSRPCSRRTVPDTSTWLPALRKLRGQGILLDSPSCCWPLQQPQGASAHSAASAVCCAGNLACTSAQVRLMLVRRCRSVGASALPTRTCAKAALSDLGYHRHARLCKQFCGEYSMQTQKVCMLTAS